MQPDRLGPYRIEALLGRGATAEVHRAYDTDHDREVALAVVSQTLAADAGFREEFDRVTGLAADLEGPSVVPVHRSGEIDGRLFVDMRLVPGRDLSAVLADDGPMDPARAVAVVGQAARALDAAADAGLSGAVAADDVLLTGSGDDEAVHVTGLGLPAPPGTASGEHAAVRSLAALLSACLTGRVAAAGAATELPSEVRPGLPSGFDEVVRRGLGDDPGERYATCADLAAAASAVLHPAATPADAPATGPASGPGRGSGSSDRGGGVGRGRGAGRLRFAVAALAVLALLAVVLAVVLSGSGDPGAAEPTTAPPTQPVTTTPSAPPDDAAQDRLRSIIPGDFLAADCDPGEPTDDGALAVLGCGSSANQQPGAEDSVFWLYRDAPTAARVFLADMERNGIAPLQPGAACPAVQGHGVYAIGGERAGRIACYIDADNDAVLAWTQDDVAAEGLVVIIDGGQPGLDSLYQWWTDPAFSQFLPR